MQNNLTSQAYELISKKIIYLSYKPGEKISEKQIEDDIKIGRTPVREALLRLRQEKLIDVVPQSGTYISKIDLKAVLDARLIRTSIEQQIMKEASEPKLSNKDRYTLKLNLLNQEEAMKMNDFNNFLHLDDQFHHTFYIITNHTQIWEWIKMINIQFDRFRFLSLKLQDQTWKQLLEDHKNILDAVEHNNLSKVKYITEKHLHLALEEEKSVVNKFPDYFINVDCT